MKDFIVWLPQRIIPPLSSTFESKSKLDRRCGSYDSKLEEKASGVPIFFVTNSSMEDYGKHLLSCRALPFS